MRRPCDRICRMRFSVTSVIPGSARRTGAGAEIQVRLRNLNSAPVCVHCPGMTNVIISSYKCNRRIDNVAGSGGSAHPAARRRRERAPAAKLQLRPRPRRRRRAAELSIIAPGPKHLRPHLSEREMATTRGIGQRGAALIGLRGSASRLRGDTRRAADASTWPRLNVGLRAARARSARWTVASISLMPQLHPLHQASSCRWPTRMCSVC